jgi:hypothetical protein
VKPRTLLLVLALSLAAAAQRTPADAVRLDFGGRRDHRYPVPAHLLGAQLGWIPNGFYKQRAALQQLRQAGFTSMRMDARLQKIYASPTPDWTEIDSVVSALLDAGFEPLIMVGYTPGWLQPDPNPCATAAAAYHAAPRNVQRWADLAAELVAHLDRAFPARVRDYEIWNEPDTPAGLCVSPAGRRRETYMQMYRAAYLALRAQARRDRAAIRIGGPALSKPESAGPWISGLLALAGSRPDFISYHHYAGDASGNPAAPSAEAAVTWPSLLARTTGRRQGIAAEYGRVRRVATAKGKSPDIYLDEYNTTSAYRPDCCRNDSRYAPVWNALVLQELLNASYRGAGVPERVMYFAAQDWFADAPPGTAWFCLLGVGSRMDCDYSSGKADPYPQFYAYALLAGRGYLQLSQGGYLAASPGAPATQHVHTSAWYTEAGDSVLISNSGGAVRTVAVVLERTGPVKAEATRFLLDRENPGIAAEPLQMSVEGTNLRATLRLPPFSVLGIFLPAARRNR